jgi:predicted dehydrogenase
MAETPVRVGVIGCGFYAQNHLHAWHDLAAEGVVLAGVCDTDPVKASAAADKFGSRAFVDAADMIDALQPDLIDVVTQAGAHRPLAELAADRKIGAIVQKPLAPTWDDCVAIAGAVTRAGIFFGVHENFRFRAAVLRVKQLIDNGVIGQPTFARISFRTHYDVYRAQPYLRREPRLIVLDLGIHLLDVVRVCVGEVAAVSCLTQKRAPDIAGEDTATMLLSHASGAVSVVDCSFSAHRARDGFPEVLIELEGDDGCLALGQGERIEVSSRGLTWSEDVMTPTLGWTERPWHMTQESVLLFNRHALEAFRAGRQPDTAIADNLATYALVESAYESASLGHPVAPRHWP